MASLRQIALLSETQSTAELQHLCQHWQHHWPNFNWQCPEHLSPDAAFDALLLLEDEAPALVLHDWRSRLINTPHAFSVIRGQPQQQAQQIAHLLSQPQWTDPRSRATPPTWQWDCPHCEKRGLFDFIARS
jgi:hypothetical protein